MDLSYATLCSGGELFGAGARDAGLKHVWGIEMDDRIAEVARLNDFNVVTRDITTFDFEALDFNLFLLHCSPPCQGASIADANGMQQRILDSQISTATCRAIAYFRPQYFTLENVVPYRHFDAYQGILDQLDELGYGYEVRHINMADYGVPQTRRRLILVASRDILANCPSQTQRRLIKGLFPPPTHCEHNGFFRKRWVSWYKALEDRGLLGSLPSGQFTVNQWNQLLKTGRDLEMLIQYGFVTDTRNTKRQNTLRLYHEPFYTVTATMHKGHAKGILPKGKTFKGSAEMYAVIQSVPEWYKFGSLKGVNQRIIGNGVPSKFAEVLCKHLVKMSKREYRC